MKIYLHVGLHKTATTFLQKNVFSKLSEGSILYNPFRLIGLCNIYYKISQERGNTLLKVRKEFNQIEKKVLTY